ncbi:DUF1800 domain-containing protein [Paracoccus contaminans]|uniref:DUF1800 domain-containing protein n=1 Tax=Paracoccus contaminans TaxID=1945662 RepID=A0A1W6CTZ3_9RHOB|nr:DUF1800 domain-containing protein [Paracoccus contaminans]ARJ68324.1 hypothetical protein B0A89_00230 [Paracoccus contaminans]
MTPAYPELAAIRLGYGLSPRHGAPDHAALVLESVQASTVPEGWTAEQASRAQSELDAARKGVKEQTVSMEEYRALNQRLNGQRLEVLRGRIARALDAPAGFGERLVQFWADHFTTVAQNPPQQIMAGAFVDEAIRPHLNGRFADMLVASSTHPMMLVYLNQNSSYGPNSPFVRRRPGRNLGLNENLGREIMELHTLGVGASYSQADVRELAELLTGLTYSPRDPVRFRPQIAEPGADRVLGRTYGGRGTDGMAEIARALGDLAAAPATADHIARKLAVHFAADDPPAALVADLAATWRASGGDLAQVNAVLAGHPALAQTFRAKVRQPLDYLVAALRALGVSGDQVRAFDTPATNQILSGPLQLMGQPFNRARGPDGWPEPAEAWITPQMLSARIAWALRIPSKLVDPLPDPRALLSAALGNTASPPLAAAVPRAENAREGVAIVLASTDFIRR